MEGKTQQQQQLQQQLVIIDAGQALFIERPRYGSKELPTSEIESIISKTKLDTVGLDELATLPENEYKFIFLTSHIKDEYINRIKQLHPFLKGSQFELIQQNNQSNVSALLAVIQQNQQSEITFVSHRQHKFAQISQELNRVIVVNRILYSGFAQNVMKRRASETASYQTGLVDYHISSLTQIVPAIHFIKKVKSQILTEEQGRQQQPILNVGYYFDYKKLHQTLSYGILRANYPFRYTPIDFSLPHGTIPFDRDYPINVLVHKFQDFFKDTSDAGKEQTGIKQMNILNFISNFKDKVGIIDDIWKFDAVRTRVATTNEILRILSLPQIVQIVEKYPGISISTPKILIYDCNKNTLSETIEIVKEQLEFPVLVKAIEASSTPASHKMAIIHNIQSLINFLTNSPLSQLGVIIQELINHGGIINKLYVAAEYSMIQARVSIPDLDSSIYGNSDSAIWEFDSQKPFRDQLPIEVPQKLESSISKLHPTLMEEFSQGFRENLGINLFGYDIIQKTNTNEYYIVDINCFPGFKNTSNLPKIFEDLFVFVAKKLKK